MFSQPHQVLFVPSPNLRTSLALLQQQIEKCTLKQLKTCDTKK